MKEKTIGFALCGSYCTYGKVIPELIRLKQLYSRVIPIMSETSYQTDSRFGAAADFIAQIENICEEPILHSITDVEPIGPKHLVDVLVVAPCTGNTLAKLANGVTDTAVTMACKSHLRNQQPVVIGISTNDGLYTSAENIGKLLAKKHFYFIPFGQDQPTQKPNSLVADFTQLPETIEAALAGQQLQPVLIAKNSG